MTLGGVGLYFWSGLGESDCYFTTDIFLQLRMCEKEFVGEPQQVNWIGLAVPILTIGIGMFLIISCKRNLKF